MHKDERCKNNRKHGNRGIVHGTKYDQGKPRVDLVPPKAILAVAEVMAYGASKYGDRNWEQGLQWSRLYAAAQRHLLAFWSCESWDEESGYSHLAHAAACILMLLDYQLKNRYWLDDRR